MPNGSCSNFKEYFQKCVKVVFLQFSRHCTELLNYFLKERNTLSKSQHLRDIYLVSERAWKSGMKIYLFHFHTNTCTIILYIQNYLYINFL